MDLLEQHKEMMEVLNKIEENTRATKEILEELAGYDTIKSLNKNALEFADNDKSQALQERETSEAIPEKIPANEPEGQPQAS